MIVLSIAAEGLLVLRMQIFGLNVVSYRWLALSMHILTSIRAVCTLLVTRLQVIVCVHTAPSGTSNTFSVVSVYRMFQVPGQINSLYRLLILGL
jgi:hypothetical protein